MTKAESILRAMVSVLPIAGVSLGLLAFEVDYSLTLLASAGMATFVSSGWAVFSDQARNPLRVVAIASMTLFIAAILWTILRGVPMLAYLALGILLISSWVLWTVSMLPPPRVVSLSLALAGSLAVIFFSLALRQPSGTTDLIVLVAASFQEGIVIYLSIRIARYTRARPQSGID